MRCDWTGEPPGEFTTIATVGNLEKLKAFSIGPATEASASPGRKGVTMPIGPVNRSTGTTGPRLKKRICEPSREAPGTRAGPTIGPAQGLTQDLTGRFLNDSPPPWRRIASASG